MGNLHSPDTPDPGAEPHSTGQVAQLTPEEAVEAARVCALALYLEATDGARNRYTAALHDLTDAWLREAGLIR